MGVAAGMRLSLGYFKKYIEFFSPKTYTIISSSLKNEYASMFIFNNPNSLCFKNNSDYLCINLVSHVLFDGNDLKGRAIFRIVCDSLFDECGKTYVLMLS